MSRNGETFGPIEDAQLMELTKAGMRGAMLRDEASPHWIPIEQSPFAQFLPAPVAAPAPARTQTIWEKPVGRISALVLLGILLSITVIWALGGERKTPPIPEVVTEPASPAPPRRPREPTLEERLNATKDLTQALPLLRPSFDDHHGDEISPGAAMLAVWMVRQPTADIWRTLEKMPDNKRGEVEKDPAAFRGKKLCTRGSITQIFTDRSTVKPIYFGVLGAGWSGFVRFIAVGSTRGLVESTPAYFCGVVIGIHSYNTQIGGTTSAVEVVGAFDLEENR